MAVVEREHTRREIAENAFEIRARRLRRTPRFLGLLLGIGELKRHRIEGFGENAELVARRDGLPAREIALRNGARAFGEEAKRWGEPLRENDGQAKRRGEREQQREGQRHGIEPL